MGNNTNYEEALRDINGLIVEHKEEANKLSSAIYFHNVEIDRLNKEGSEIIEEELKRNGFIGKRFAYKGKPYELLGAVYSHDTKFRFRVIFSQIKKDGTLSVLKRHGYHSFTMNELSQFLSGELDMTYFLL